MSHREFAPPAALRESVRCFWHERRAGPARIDVLPDGHPEIVFHAGGPCRMEDGSPLPSPFVMALLDGPVALRTDGPLDILGIRCFPWTVYELLGLPSGTAAIDLTAHPIATLQPTVARALLDGRVDDAVAALARHLSAGRVDVDRLLARAGGAMRDAGGTLPVVRVAAAAHATVRTLERRFKRASGRTVKDVSGLMRFEQVRNRLWIDPDADLAGLAQEYGYADQPHLSREFKRYSGTTPAAFAQGRREENKS
ncbi:helix-turn-helix domain-containing protein [Massilia sp. YIM B02763]|uniref:AraC family transcriptional regulator n=1 Tax=Massilia sp. YIM B02763 TaxID=3050130 RepID=UPI0025B6B1BC|nr:AraC family transcriptional regulator [Massilia sp. YIM B02763]MDN4055670.1 helix-turn-helix domain-containing protein [Massilia sp. YIM B02763]